MSNTEIAKQALNNILDYIGELSEYKNNAQLITYIEWAIRRGHQND